MQRRTITDSTAEENTHHRQNQRPTATYHTGIIGHFTHQWKSDVRILITLSIVVVIIIIIITMIIIIIE